MWLIMAFWKRGKEKKKKDMEEIKDTVKGKEKGKESKPLPPQQNKPLPPPPPSRVTTPEGLRPPEKQISPEMAPLFVKIDKYKEVLSKLDQLKMILKKMTRLISLSYEIDEIKGDLTGRIRNTTSKITDTLISLDEIFVKPEKYRPESIYEKKTHEVEGQIYDLQEELKHLRKELSKIE